MMKRLYVLLFSLCLLMACQEEDTSLQGKMGYLRLDVAAVSSTNTKSAVPENYNPKQLHVEIEDASGVGTVGNAKCGDIMRMFLDIDENGIIREAKFKTFGCGAAVATSSMATELVKGKTIQEALQVTNKAVMEALDGLPPVKVHCSLLAEEAIHAALWDYAEKNHITIEGLQKPKNDISEGEEEEDY